MARGRPRPGIPQPRIEAQALDSRTSPFGLDKVSRTSSLAAGYVIQFKKSHWTHVFHKCHLEAYCTFSGKWQTRTLAEGGPPSIKLLRYSLGFNQPCKLGCLAARRNRYIGTDSDLFMGNPYHITGSMSDKSTPVPSVSMATTKRMNALMIYTPQSFKGYLVHRRMCGRKTMLEPGR